MRIESSEPRRPIAGDDHRFIPAGNRNHHALQGRARALLEDCQLSESGLGLQAGEHARAWLTECWLRGNSQCGLLAEGESDLELQSCQVRHNGGDGLNLRGQCRAQVRNCTIQNNSAAGVRFSERVILERASNSVTNNPQGDWLEARA